MKCLRILRDYCHDEGGQTSTEYILLVAIVAMIVMKFKDILVPKLTGLINKVFQKTDSILDGI
jgi:pilus assembly protein Flp/PilA